MNYDITFCTSKDCKDKRCIRHHTNAPKGVYVSNADFSNSPIMCPTYNENSDTLLDRVMKNEDEVFTKEQVEVIKRLIEDYYEEKR